MVSSTETGISGMVWVLFLFLHGELFVHGSEFPRGAGEGRPCAGGTEAVVVAAGDDVDVEARQGLACGSAAGVEEIDALVAAVVDEMVGDGLDGAHHMCERFGVAVQYGFAVRLWDDQYVAVHVAGDVHKGDGEIVLADDESLDLVAGDLAEDAVLHGETSSRLDAENDQCSGFA